MSSSRIGSQLGRNIIGYLALFVALGGTGAYAADKIGSRDIATEAIRSKHIDQRQIKSSHLRAGSVTSRKLRAGSVTSRKLRAGSVTSRKVRDGSLRARDFAPGVLAAGGGLEGELGTINVTVRSALSDPDAGPSAEVDCESGEIAVGGGVTAHWPGDYVNTSVPVVSDDLEAQPIGWYGSWDNAAGGTARAGTVYVICAAT